MKPVELLLGDRVLHGVVLLRRIEARVDLDELSARVLLEDAGDAAQLALNVGVRESERSTRSGSSSATLPGCVRGGAR